MKPVFSRYFYVGYDGKYVIWFNCPAALIRQFWHAVSVKY
jgi:hypothetical protein